MDAPKSTLTSAESPHGEEPLRPFKKSFWERAYADHDPEAIAFLKKIGYDAYADIERINKNNFATREGYSDDFPMFKLG